MTDVFVSYKREDHARVALLVEVLEANGLSVWWDHALAGGDQWRADIAKHLAKAACVIVIWTHDSVSAAGDFVHDEARRAKERGVLLPVFLDNVEAPVGFGEIQAVDLRGWHAGADARLGVLVADVRARIALGPRVPAAARARRIARGIAALSAPAVLLAAAVAFLANLWQLQTLVCKLPGLSNVCAHWSLGGAASAEERALWEGRVSGDCEVLRRIVTEFPRGGYHAEAARRLAAAAEVNEESWVAHERRLPLTVRAPLSGAPNQEGARAAALAASEEDVALVCAPYGEVSGHRLTGMRAEPSRWRCNPAPGGQACGFDGYAICSVDVRTIEVREQCP